MERHEATNRLEKQRRALLYLSLVLLASCAVGPNYERPVVDTPAAYRTEAEPATAPGETVPVQSFAELPWWDVFQDPVLKDLIDEALANSYDIRIVASRVEQARYAVGVTRADLLPQVSYEGAAQRGRAFNPLGNDNVTGNEFLGAFQMAWEIDLWGRIRRATEASLATLFATEDVQRAVILSLVTDVAQAYFELRELDLELEIAQRTRQSFQDTLDLFTRQLVGGVGNKLATSRAEAALASTAATIPDLKRQIVAKENQISILLGRNPGPIARGTALTQQTYPPDVPPGLPAALLERRPDILEAEQNLVVANALVGVSIADFLPRIGLTTLYGGQSTELENIVRTRQHLVRRRVAVGPDLSRRAALLFLQGQRRRLGGREVGVRADRAERARRGVQRFGCPAEVRRVALRARASGTRAARIRAPRNVALHRRAGELLRSTRSTTAALPRRELPGAHRAEPVAGRGPAVQRPRGRLAGGRAASSGALCASTRSARPHRSWRRRARGSIGRCAGGEVSALDSNESALGSRELPASWSGKLVISRKFAEAEEVGELVPETQSKFTQISAGEFSGKMTRVELGDLVMHHISSSPEL